MPRVPALALTCLLFAAASAAAHGAPDPAGGFTRVAHDCNDDWGGDSANLNGHDLIAVDVKENESAGEHFLVLRLYYNGGFADAGSPDHVRDRLTFDGPDGQVETWIRAEPASEGSFPKRAYNQQVTIMEQGTPAAWIDGPHRFLKDGTQDNDGNRAYVDIGLRLTDLGYSGDETLSDFAVQGYSGASSQADQMPGSSAAACASASEAADPQYYDAGTYTVEGFDLPPTADFTFTPAAPDAATSVSFNGSASDDKGISTWSWDFGDGDTSSQEDPSHRFDAGTYTVALTVTDTGGQTASHQATITVAEAPNQAPTASFQSFADDLTLSVNGSASVDPEGDALTYAWDFGDGATADTATATHTYTSAGSYDVTLTVTDADGASGSAGRTITVADGTSSPIVSIAWTPEAPTESQTVVLSGSATDDGTVVTWQWSIDGETYSGQEIAYAFTPGTHTVTLRATDDDGLVGTAQATITIAADEEDTDDAPAPADPTGDTTAPIARLLTRPASAFVGQQVTFLDRSTDDVAVTVWAWDFGDGTTSDERNPRHAYTEAGRYTVSLTVLDAAGNEDEATLDLTITRAAGLDDAEANTPLPVAVVLAAIGVALARRRA